MARPRVELLAVLRGASVSPWCSALPVSRPDAMGVQAFITWSQNAEKRAHVVLEYLNVDDRRGPRQRLEPFHVEHDPMQRTFRFVMCPKNKSDRRRFTLTVPVPDIDWVYFEQKNEGNDREDRIVRVRGAIVGAAEPQPSFTSFA